MIHTDCYYTSSQRPKKNCQDFSICGVDPFPYVILCDGCSASENTDLGARILAFAAKKMIGYLEGDISDAPPKVYSAFGNIVSGVCKESIKILNLNSTCLDSTLIIAFKWGKRVNVFMYGDGVISSLLKNGKRNIEMISYLGNAPYYLSYLVDKDRLQSYKEFASQMNGYIKTENSNGIIKVVRYDYPTILSYNIEDLSLLLVASDGMESFIDFNEGGRLPCEAITNELMSIKSKKGEFIKRRSIRMLEDFSKLNIYNTDDFSVGALMVEEENEN